MNRSIIVSACLFVSICAIPGQWAAPPTARAQDCLNYERYLHRTGQVDPGGICADVQVAGDLALLALWEHGISVLDVSGSGSPLEIGSMDTPGTAADLTVVGDYVYVADGPGGLQVIDISIPGNPVIVGSTNTDPAGSAQAVVVAGDYAYVADFSRGLYIVDVSSPDAPAVVGQLPSSSAAWELAINGDVVYLAARFQGVKIVDVSDPAQPQVVGTLATPSAVYDIAVDGDLAYVAADTALLVLDVGSPSAPVIVGSLPIAGSAFGVDVAGDKAYVAAQEGGTAVVDVTTPASPTLLDVYLAWDTSYGVDAAGGHLYIADASHGCEVLKIAAGVAATTLAAIDTTDDAMDVAFQVNYAFVGTGTHLVALDLSDWQNPEFAGDIRADGSEFVIRYSYAYLSRRDKMTVVNINSPHNMHVASTVDVVGSVSSLAVHGSFLYATKRADGMDIYSLANPSVPALVGTWEPPFSPSDIAIQGNHAYLPTDGGLQVVDLTVPDAPVAIGSLATVEPGRLHIDGNLLYVAVRDFGLQIVDITVPTSPVLVGSFSLPYGVTDVTASGDVAYVTCYRWLGYPGEMYVVDVADPTAPALLGGLTLSSTARRVMLWDSKVCMAADADGLVLARPQCLPPASVPGDEATPGAIRLLSQNHPNPFNPRTTIAFELPQREAVTLRVFDMAGRLVRTLISGEVYGQGRHEVIWRGKDGSGHQCASGTYFYRFEAGVFSETKRMTLIK